MIKFRITTFIRGLLMLFALGAVGEMALSDTAFARAGGSRSMGRSYQRPSTPPPRQQFNNPQAQPPSQRGGFMRGLAGGLAGGFLGSMLFSSMGHAAGGAGGMGGGGIGLLEIILLAGVGFLLFRWWKNRQMSLAGHGGNQSAYAPNQFSRNETPSSYGNDLAGQGAFASSLNSSSQLSSEEASDIFFKIQGAWTRRNLQTVRSLLGDEMAANLQRDLDDLLREKRINRLENISVRSVEVGESWQEQGVDFVRMTIRASLLDYTIDEQSSRIVQGSDSEPVKFAEDWIFSRSPSSAGWQLVGIQQIQS